MIPANGIDPKLLDVVADEGCCEEASIVSIAFYIPCNKPATKTVRYPDRAEGPYRMCDACADHNVQHRGGEYVE